MSKRTKEQTESAKVNRIMQRGMEARGETWDLQIVLSGDGEKETLATLARFRKRANLASDVRRRVIAAARAALIANDKHQARITEVNRAEIAGLRALQGTGFWLNAFIGNLLSGFASGERVTPQQVVLALAESIEAIESLSAGSVVQRKLTGKTA